MSYEAQGARTSAIEPGIIARVGRKLRSSLDAWFGPDVPMQPSAPAGTPFRVTDYPSAYNVNIQPRSMEATSFEQMRAIADSFDLVRLCIETRKDQVSRMPWSFRVKSSMGKSGSSGRGRGRECDDPRLRQLTDFFACPDREHTWQQWVRLVLEDLLVLDAPALAPVVSQDGELWSPGKELCGLEVIDGATIARKIDPMGRTPAPPSCQRRTLLRCVMPWKAAEETAPT